MTKVFNQLTLRDKLLLFAIIPLTSLIILASCRVHELINDYQAIEHEKITINIVKQVTAAIDASANEQNIEQPRKIAAVPSFASLSIQQNRTYKATSTLINSQFVQQLLASGTITHSQKIDIENRLAQIKVLNDKLIHIKVSANNHDAIHTIYQSLYEELFILLNQLKTQLRYIRQARHIMTY
ncbi:hypothetical protein [Shewanella marina]|uniref:hypothetical protein n=1 Tax=Shewanella marina TaxID=487319 RepID=UPI0006891026|nr:hypothetical protein [Shewanella marina]